MGMPSQRHGAKPKRFRASGSGIESGRKQPAAVKDTGAMIKNNQTKLNSLHVALDALVTGASYLLAWYLMIGMRQFGEGHGTLAFTVYLRALILIIPVYLVLYAMFRLYTPKRVQSRRSEFARICKANIMGLMMMTFVLFGGRNFPQFGPYLDNFSARMIIAFFGINTLLETLMRNIIRSLLRDIRARGFNQKHILLVGFSDAAKSFIDRVEQNPAWGYHIYGILDDEQKTGSAYKGVKVIGELTALRGILAQNKLDEIAVTLPLDKYEYLKPVVNICEKSGVHTKFIPDYQNIIPTTPYTEDLEGLPVINIRHVPLTEPLNAMMKRTIDLCGGMAALILFSPVMLVVACIIKLTSDGPVIYAQERVGLHNKPFRMYKFRSMYQQRPEEEKKGWTTKGDPRVTPIGHFIRHTNIDELPQLINVLKGDMSLVGPRPERPQFVEKFKEEIPRYMIKHQVRPGMTGWAQVNGLRGDTSIAKRIEYDLYYIENWTLGLDFKILFMTVFKGFKNAY